MNKVEEKQSERVPEIKESTKEEIEEIRPDASSATVTPAVEPVASINEKETDNLASLQSDLLKWLAESEKKMKEIYQSIVDEEKIISFNKEFDAARYFITDLTIRLKELMIQPNSIDRDVIYLKLRNKKIKLHVNNVDDVNAAIKHFLDDYKVLDKVSKSYLDSLIKILNKYLISIAPKLKDQNRYAAKFFRTSQTAENISDDVINNNTKPTP